MVEFSIFSRCEMLGVTGDVLLKAEVWIIVLGSNKGKTAWLSVDINW